MNEVHVRGEVKSEPWTYDGNLYVRISVRRERDRPKRVAQDGGNYDYMTVVFPGMAEQGLALRKQQILAVHGWLQSRDVDETLANFLKRANGNKNGANDKNMPANAESLSIHRSVTEIVAERWYVERGNAEPRRSKQAAAVPA